MIFQKLASQTTKLIGDNSPLILTGIGAAGVITTAVLTGKATIKAYELVLAKDPVYAHNNNPAMAFDTRDKVKLTWQLYIPPAVSGIVTVGAVIAAHKVGSRRAAAMATAYVLSQEAFAEYKDKVLEKFGETKERNLRADIAQDRMHKSPVSEREIVMTGGGNVLCFEPFTGRYFNSDMETLKKAMNDLNYQVNNNYYASLSDFYDLVGLDHTTLSDDLGWNSDELMELVFDSVVASDGRPCLTFEYKVVPIKGYARVN